MFTKEIRYDRLTRDYAMYLDGNLIGFAPTYHDAEVALNAHVYKLLQDGVAATASELDGGAVNWGLDDVPDEPPPDDGEPYPGGPDEAPHLPTWDGYNGFLGSVDALLDCAGFWGVHQDIAFDWQLAYTCGQTPMDAVIRATWSHDE